MSTTPAPSQNSALDLAKPRKALTKFLQRILDGDYRRALRHTQISWVHMHTPDPRTALERQMSVVILDGHTLTSFSVDDTPADSKVPEVFGDCMVDLPFHIEVRASGDRGYSMSGIARMICERGYMKPDPKGKWGVNPISMARGDRTDILPA